MKKQKEYMREIEAIFNTEIAPYRSIFDAYCYNDNRACEYIKMFKQRVEWLGLKFSNCYHANGIGNNNEYKIFLEVIDEDGFLVQKNIAEFYYCYGIYGGCTVVLTDLVTKDSWKISRAR